eukprot:1188617-Prorocentrum_minimum.AAC.2
MPVMVGQTDLRLGKQHTTYHTATAFDLIDSRRTGDPSREIGSSSPGVGHSFSERERHRYVPSTRPLAPSSASGAAPPSSLRQGPSDGGAAAGTGGERDAAHVAGIAAFLSQGGTRHLLPAARRGDALARTQRRQPRGGPPPGAQGGRPAAPEHCHFILVLQPLRLNMCIVSLHSCFTGHPCANSDKGAHTTPGTHYAPEHELSRGSTQRVSLSDGSDDAARTQKLDR